MSNILHQMKCLDRNPLSISVSLVVILLLGCSISGPSEAQKATSKALRDASEKCVHDVRDRNIKYDRSPNCTSLGALSQQYIDAGGGRSDTPLEVEINFERARVHAWMARALSESREPSLLRIW